MFDKKELLNLIQKVHGYQSVSSLSRKVGDERFIDDEEQSPETDLLRYCFDNKIRFKCKQKDYDEDGFFEVLEFRTDSETFYIGIPGYSLSYDGDYYYNDDASFVEPKEFVSVRYEPI